MDDFSRRIMVLQEASWGVVKKRILRKNSNRNYCLLFYFGVELNKEGLLMNEEYIQNHLGDEFFQKIWHSFNKKQELLNRQLEESDKKYKRQQEEKELLNENAEKKFLKNLDDKKRQQDKISEKYLLDYEKNRIKPDKEAEDSPTQIDADTIDSKKVNKSKSKNIDITDPQITDTQKEELDYRFTMLKALIQEAGFKIVRRSGKNVTIDLTP
jgi:hypothetical protein